MAVDKLVDSAQLDADLTIVADAIRTKGGTSAQLSFPSGMAQAIADISGGGGGAAERYIKETSWGFNFYDYDGTLVDVWEHTEVQSKQSLPVPPVTEGLTSQEWNWSLQDIKDYDTSRGSIKYVMPIGNTVVPTDGATKIYFVLSSSNVEMLLNMAVNGTATISWGDGESSTLTGEYSSVSSASCTLLRHTYTSNGNYIISIDCGENEEYTFKYITATIYCFFKPYLSSYSTEYQFRVLRLHFGTRLSSIIDNIGNNFASAIVTYSNTTTSFGFGSFGNGSEYDGRNISIFPKNSIIMDDFNSLAPYNRALRSKELISFPKDISTNNNSNFIILYDSFESMVDYRKNISAFNLLNNNTILNYEYFLKNYYNLADLTRFRFINSYYAYPGRPTSIDFTDTSIFNQSIDTIILNTYQKISEVKVNSRYFGTDFYYYGYNSNVTYGNYEVIELLDSVSNLGIHASTQISNYIKFNSTIPPTISDSSYTLTNRTSCKHLIPYDYISNYKSTTYYPALVNRYIGFNTFQTVQEILPSLTTDELCLLTWYSTISDAKSGTNSITSGSGTLYCTYTSNAPARTITITDPGMSYNSYFYTSNDSSYKYETGTYSYADGDSVTVHVSPRYGGVATLQINLNGNQVANQYSSSLTYTFILTSNTSIRFYENQYYGNCPMWADITTS